MKTCLLCGTEAKDSEPTCPNDGEATWSASRAPSAPAASTEDAPADPAPKKRVRK